MTSPVQFPALHQDPSEGAQGVQEDDAYEPRYTTAEVVRITTLTPRQLQWWDETHLLRPHQENHKRLYTRAEAFTLLLYRELRARCFTLSEVRQMQRQLRQHTPLMSAARWLLTDGSRVVLLNEGSVVLTFLEQRRIPAFHLISLDALAQKLDAAPVPLPAKREPARARTLRQYVERLRREA